MRVSSTIVFVLLFSASTALSQQRAVIQTPTPLGRLLFALTDDAGRPVAGATVMIQGEWVDLKGVTATPQTQFKTRTRQGLIDSVASDQKGNLAVPFLTVFAPRQVGATRTPIFIIERSRKLGAMLEVSPNDLDVVQPLVLHPLCFVHGTLMSPDMTADGHIMNKTVARVSTSQSRPPIVECISDQGRFGFLLPSGSYIMTIGGSATDGATYQPITQSIDIDPNTTEQDLGETDLSSSATSQLLGKLAPPFDGLIEWRNGSPLTLDQLRGKVVILDFWSYSCSICLHSMLDLFQVQQRYVRNPDVVIIAVHNRTATSLDDAYAKSAVAREKLWGGHEFPFRVALDDGRFFRACGISGIPAVLMIGRDGFVARRFWHAGVKGFNQEIDNLLAQTVAAPPTTATPANAATSPATTQAVATTLPTSERSTTPTTAPAADFSSPKAAVLSYFSALEAGDASAAKEAAFCDAAAVREVDASIAARTAQLAYDAALHKRFGRAAAAEQDVDVDAILIDEVKRLAVHTHGDIADLGDHGDYPCRRINGRWRYDLVALHRNDPADYYKFDEQMAAVDQRFATEIADGKWADYSKMQSARDAAMPTPPPPPSPPPPPPPPP